MHRKVIPNPRVWRRVLLPAFIAWLLPLCGWAAEAAATTFVGVNLTRMTYYPELNITETGVRREMGRVIAEHDGIIDFATVQDVASRITAIYRKAGFVFTRAYIPQQRSNNGWVEVRLLEGWLASIDILDNHRYSQELLERPFADLLDKVVYSPDMEEAMALLNDYPGLNAFGFYSVGEAPGSTRLNIRVQRERDWTGSIHADNYGSKLTGQLRFLVEGEKFNPTGNADHLRVSALQTLQPRNSSYGQIDYELPVFDKRSQLSARALADAFVVSRGEGREQVDISGKTHAGQLEYKRQVLRGNKDNLGWHLGVSRNVSVSDFKTIENFSLDQKTLETYLGFDFDHLNRKHGKWYGVGVDLVSGRYDAVDVPEQPREYRYAHGYAAYSKAVGLGGATHQWKLNIDWQYTHDVLPAASQYALTGPTHLRGFVPGDFSADSGAIAAATWMFPKWSLSKAKRALQPEMTMSIFAEYGYGIQNVFAANASETKGRMADAGAAWLFTLGPDLSATFTVAKPIAYSVDYVDQRATSPRAWIELLWRFH